jgi:hypothetical protein
MGTLRVLTGLLPAPSGHHRRATRLKRRGVYRCNQTHLVRIPELEVVLPGILRAAKHQQVFYRVIGRPFLRALVLSFFAILLFVAMADANVRWTALRERIADASPLQRATLFTVLVVGWSIVAGRALRPVWRQPIIAFLVRQPLSDRQWAMNVFPSICVALIPVACAWWLAPRSTDWLIHYVGFAALATPVVLGASYSGWDSLLPAGAGALTFFVLAWVYAYSSLAAYAALILAPVLTALATRPIRRQIAAVNRAVYAPLSGSGVVLTIVRRDLRYLLRCERKSLVGLAALGGVCALLMLAFRINGKQQDREALLSACLFLSVSATPLYEILETLKTGLGKEIMRHRWPVTYRQRSWALLTLVAVLMSPAATAILLFGSSMGALGAAQYLLFVAATVTVSATLFGGFLLVQRSANGLFLLLLTGHMVAILALPSAVYGLAALVVIPMGFWLTAGGFSRFTSVTERVSIDQLA